MTDKEQLDELNSKIEALVKQKTEILDSIIKSELSKDRFRFFDYEDRKYWIKIISVNESDCDIIEVFEDYSTKLSQIKRWTGSFFWLKEGIPIVEEIFNAKYNEILNKIEL